MSVLDHSPERISTGGIQIPSRDALQPCHSALYPRSPHRPSQRIRAGRRGECSSQHCPSCGDPKACNLHPGALYSPRSCLGGYPTGRYECGGGCGDCDASESGRSSCDDGQQQSGRIISCKDRRGCPPRERCSSGGRAAEDGHRGRCYTTTDAAVYTSRRPRAPRRGWWQREEGKEEREEREGATAATWQGRSLHCGSWHTATLVTSGACEGADQTTPRNPRTHKAARV
mmetsp:Transcript_37913/g.45708  ORF Transcript_37913/g.45708 Transcript_37913/m.45708 type:complete len:229 (-) Transcript_37913:318-1004(-)